MKQKTDTLQEKQDTHLSSLPNRLCRAKVCFYWCDPNHCPEVEDQCFDMGRLILLLGIDKWKLKFILTLDIVKALEDFPKEHRELLKLHRSAIAQFNLFEELFKQILKMKLPVILSENEVLAKRTEYEKLERKRIPGIRKKRERKAKSDEQRFLTREQRLHLNAQREAYKFAKRDYARANRSK